MFYLSDTQITLLANLKNEIKENLALLILIPTLLGGLHQFVELFSISPVLIRFFSVSQLLSDGLFILIYSIIVFPIPFLITKIIAEKYSKKVSKRAMVFTICVILILFMVTYFYLSSNQSPVVIFWIDIIFFSLMSLIIHLYSSAFKDKSEAIISSPKTKAFFIAYLTLCGVVFSLSMFDKVNRLSEIENFSDIEKKYKQSDKMAKVLYFNDKYIFIRNGKKIHIEKIDNLFE